MATGNPYSAPLFTMLFSAPIQKSATPRHEAKFCLPSSRVHATRAWLRHRYAFDAEYPNNMIHSLYYDTPDYALLQQKQASEYLKAKIRVRWYSDPRTGEVSDAAFLEIKAKEGVRSHKIRTPWPLTGKTMMQDPFTEARQVRLNSIIPDDWPRLNDWYRPTAVISYTRDRFSNAEKKFAHCAGYQYSLYRGQLDLCRLSATAPTQCHSRSERHECTGTPERALRP